MTGEQGPRKEMVWHFEKYAASREVWAGIDEWSLKLKDEVLSEMAGRLKMKTCIGFAFFEMYLGGDLEKSVLKRMEITILQNVWKDQLDWKHKNNIWSWARDLSRSNAKTNLIKI